MNIKNLIKKRNTSTKIVNPRDTLNISEPTPEENNIVEKYREEYINKLKGKVLTSLDLEIDRFVSDMQMFSNLTSYLIKNESKNAFSKSYDEESSVDLITRVKKIILYLNNILTLKRDLELKLIALEQITKEHRILSLIKRSAIQNKISSIILTLYSFNTTGQGLLLESLAILNDYKNLREEEKINTRNIRIANEKKETLIKMINLIIPDKIEDYKSKYFETIFEEIAYLEHLLEIKVYTHKKSIESIKKEITNLDIKKPNSLDEINTLELKLRTFYEFGINLVTDDTIKNLYRKKFLILTRDINDCTAYLHSSFIGLGNIESKTYEEIIKEKLNKILKEKNASLFSVLNGYFNDGLKIVKLIFKDENGKHSYLDILYSRLKLAFLLSFETPSTLKSFFRDFTVYKSSYKNELDFEENRFFWKEILPFETICRIALCEENENPIYLFYSLKSEAEGSLYKTIYYLPEGITHIQIKDTGLSVILHKTTNDSKILKSIRANASGKVVYTPKTLKSIHGDLFDGVKIKALFLNEGFITLREFPINKYEIDTIGIPSTFDKITDSKTSFHLYSSDPKPLRTLKHLEFYCEEEPERIKNALLNCLIYCFELEIKEIIDIKIADELFSHHLYFDLTENRKTSPHHIKYPMRPLIKYYKVVPLIDSIRFISYKNSGLNISIDKSMLTDEFCVKRKGNEDPNGLLEERELNNLINSIMELAEKEYKKYEKSAQLKLGKEN